jgi:hypothetical protein
VTILPLDLADADATTVAAAAAAAAAGGGGGRPVVFGPLMLKVKDWPPADDFVKEMPRHMVVSCWGCVLWDVWWWWWAGVCESTTVASTVGI